MININTIQRFIVEQIIQFNDNNCCQTNLSSIDAVNMLATKIVLSLKKTNCLRFDDNDVVVAEDWGFIKHIEI